MTDNHGYKMHYTNLDVWKLILEEKKCKSRKTNQGLVMVKMQKAEINLEIEK